MIISWDILSKEWCECETGLTVCEGERDKEEAEGREGKAGVEH